MTDDTGFGVSSTFGGVIPTPNLDRVAANGLRYTNFNSTALCSPILAAGRSEYTWNGEIAGTPNGDAPSILNASYNFKAEIEMPAVPALGLGVPQNAGDGMIVTQGGRFGGYGFYVLNRKPVFL
jgi:hypothetical protein